MLINLGDPLLRKYDTNLEVYNTDFDGGLGTEVFSDPNKTIFTVKPLDFNNDGLQDLIVVYTDGTVKLSKNYGYGTGANFKNLENLMLIAVGIQDVYVGDVDGNGYPDIIVQTTNNQLRVYTNNFGKFDVDGNPICLNTNVNEGNISETPIDTSGVYQIFLEDMDKDGSLDIITNDKKGFVKIFYGGKNGQNTYVSTNKATCDTGRYNRQAVNTTIITRFGIKLNADEVVDNSMAHRYGLNERYMANSGLNIDPASLDSLGAGVPNVDEIGKMLNGMSDEQLKNFNPADLYNMVAMQDADPNAMAAAGADATLKYQEITTDTLNSGKKTNIFIPISYLDTSANKDPDNVEIYKIYKDLNGDILENGDIVEIQVHFKAGKKGFVGAFGDKIQGPRKVSLNNNGIPKSLADNLQLYTTNPYKLILHEGDQNFSYLMDNIRINPNQTRSYSYQVIYSDTQTQLISLEDIDGTKYGTGYEDIKLGGDVDIKLQPADGCIKFMKAFVNQPNDTHRTYTTKDINLNEIIINYTEKSTETQS